MISDLEGMLVEQALQDLRECNKIQSNSVQTLVSCPRPAHRPLPPLPPLPIVSPQLSPKLRHLAERDLQGYGCVQRGHQRRLHLSGATRA